MRPGLLAACAAVACLVADPVEAQNHYPLELLLPAPIDTAANGGRHADHRIYIAHPDLVYNIRASAIGGRPPHRYEIRNQPAGMTIVGGFCTVVARGCDAGTINWPDPTGTTVTPEVRGCDSDGDCTSWVAWTITISATRYRFIDADCSGCDATGDGTIGTPWQTFAKAWNTMTAGQILVFVGDAGTRYDFATLTPAAKSDCGVGSINLTETSRPVIWLSTYTTTQPVLDFGDGAGENAPCVLITGSNVWVDDIEFTDGHNQGFQVGHSSRYGSVFRRNYFHDFGPTSIAGGSNPGMINFQQLYGSGGTPGADTEAIAPLIQNNLFDSESGEIGGTKLYSTLKAVEENNEYRNGGDDSHQIDWKSDHRQFTSRGSLCTGSARRCLGGNLHGNSGASYGEIYFNYYAAISGTGFNFGAVMLNEDSELGQRRTGTPPSTTLESVAGANTYVYRNTFASRVVLWNVDANDGPITLADNVLINENDGASPFDGVFWTNGGGASGSWTGTADTSRVTSTGNVTESSATGVINESTGDLVGQHLIDYGPATAQPRGHMLGTAVVPRLRVRLRSARLEPTSVGWLPLWMGDRVAVGVAATAIETLAATGKGTRAW